jgi:hypothetical protein
MTPLDGWENFYVIVGSSAGALIGLQFVVMTLLADMPVARADAQAGEAFGTPNVVQFGVALFLSAVITAPWHGIAAVAVLWGLLGLAGVVYAAVVARRMRLASLAQAVRLARSLSACRERAQRVERCSLDEVRTFFRDNPTWR